MTDPNIPFPVLFTFILFLADIIFLTNYNRRSIFPLRLILCLTAQIGINLLLFRIEGNILYDTLIFAAVLLLTTVWIHFCSEIVWLDAFFVSLAGYSTQAIGAELDRLVISLLTESGHHTFLDHRFLLMLISHFFVYVTVFFIYGRRPDPKKRVSLGGIPLLVFLTLIIGVDISLSDVFRLSNRTVPADYALLLVCCILVLVLQFSLLRTRSLEDELAIVHQLQIREKEQFKFSREVVDQLNIKFHDMRHQIRKIGRESSISKDVVHEIESSINIYDNIFHTGNSALDTILTEKLIYCQANSIVVSCIADGNALSFISDVDIYSLFGNLLENAINAVMKLPEAQRIISLTVKKENSLVSVHSDNYYSGMDIMVNGMPKSTSKHPEDHGFGTRSMKLITEKYGGTISFLTEDNIFLVNILFPVTQ